MARRWTEEEKSLVCEKWGIWTIRRISNFINRTDYAVIRFAEKNKLGSAYKSYYLTTEEVAKMFKIDPTTVNRYWINKYGLKARIQPMKERSYYRIDFDDLYDWCKENQDKWKACNLEEYGLGIEEDWLKEKRKKDNNIITKKRGSQWTTKELIKLDELIAEGKSSREIAEIIGRSFYSVKRQRQRQLHKKEEIVA